MLRLEIRRFSTIPPLALLLFLLATPLYAGVPGSTSPINIDAQGLALQGYDPVAYFVDGKPTRGTTKHSVTYGGARYLFVSHSHRALFLKDPKKYLPEFGGFCSVGTAYGEKVDIDPGTGRIIGGKLYLNNNQKAEEIFDRDTHNTISRAEQNWPAVKDKAL